MKFVSGALVVRLALCVGVVFVAVQAGFAADEPSNGELSRYLANKLFCDTVAILEGQVGLLIGLILVFTGLWSMIQGARPMVALPVMLTGALVTAVPSLILSSFEGLGALLNEAGITDKAFKAPTCPAPSPAQKALDDAMKNRSGQYYPSRGVYDPAKVINSMTPDIEYNPQTPRF